VPDRRLSNTEAETLDPSSGQWSPIGKPAALTDATTDAIRSGSYLISQADGTSSA
jgi:hypothetical protein